MRGTPKILWPALRQYRHNNDNSPSLTDPEQGFVAAFDYDEVIKIVEQQAEEIAALRERNAALEKVAEAAEKKRRADADAENVSGFVYYQTIKDLDKALREAGYLGEEG